MDKVNGILLLYHHRFKKDANTIIENIRAFEKYSIYKVFPINTELGFPEQLFHFSFSIIVIHYSMFRSYSFDYIRNYLEVNKNSYIIAFFQDEYHFCKERFDLINRYNIDCVYTLIEPSYFQETYQKYTHTKKMICCLPGYVSEELVEEAKKYFLPDEVRPIDIGYRGRPLPPYMGKGSQEKTEIAEKFLEKVDKSSWRLDIKIGEKDRIYGDAWYRFLANCRGVLGVESGVTIFDLNGEVYRAFKDLEQENTRVSYEDLAKAVDLTSYEDKMFYRTISPRHFEAAALRVCQILYEGNYSGILKPNVHYIPLKKDFSNFNEIIRHFSDPTIRRNLVDNAYRDLIRSGDYSYHRFINDFDRNLIEAGFESAIDKKTVDKIDSVIHWWTLFSTMKRIPILPIYEIYDLFSPSHQKKISRMCASLIRLMSGKEGK